MEDSSEKGDVDWLALDDDLCLDISDDELNPLVMDVCPSSPILGKPSGRQNKVLKDSQDSTTPLSPATSEASVVNASQDNAGSVSDRDLAPRSVKLCGGRNVGLPNKSKLPLKRPGRAIAALAEKKSNTENLAAPSLLNEKGLLVGSLQRNKSVSDDDAISLYVKDEDCFSLYQSKRSRVHGLGRGSFRGGRERSVITRKDVTLRPHHRITKPDLRNTIRKPDNVTEVDSLLSECNRMLNTNCYENVVIAAEMFCKAYTDHVFQKESQALSKFARRLVCLLLRHKEMKYLYRVVRLTITMNIHLDEDVICDFVESMCNSKEYGKVNIILNQLRDASLVYGDRIKSLFAKHVKTPARNSMLPTKNARIVSNMSDSLCRGSFFDTSQLPNQQNDVSRKSGVLDAVSTGPAGLNWKKSQLLVEIPDDPQKNRITHVYEESDSENTGRAATSMGNCFVKTEQRKEVDFVKLGSCVTEMLEAVGHLQITTSLFSAFADLIVSTGIHSPSNNFQSLDCLDSFVVSAIQHASDKECIQLHMSRICAEVSKMLPPKLAYQVARYIQRVGLKLVPAMCDGRSSQCKRKARFFAADAIVNNCLEHNDLNLALVAVDQYLAEVQIDFGPFLSPLICKMLCKVAEVAYAEKRHMDAAKCCTLLPAGFGDGSEAALMGDILLEILTNPESFRLLNDEKVCNSMVDQMLTRGLATEVRRIIVKAFSANVVPVFKFLERKGVYQKPQIARDPHCINIPYILCVEEMAMTIQRHLTELSEFLVEMGESVRMDIPMTIVLSRTVGSLRSFSTIKSPQCNYKNSLTRLIETLSKVVSPSLDRHSQKFLSSTEEFQINVDIASVRSWMLANTNYHERSVLKKV